MRSVICPFCGMATEVRHETQEACIQALQAEIDRTKRVLAFVTEPLRPPTTTDDEAQAT